MRDVITAVVCWTEVGVTAADVVGVYEVEGDGDEELRTEAVVTKVEDDTGTAVVVEGGIEVDVKKVDT